jgi:hypothetical protein
MRAYLPRSGRPEVAVAHAGHGGRRQAATTVRPNGAAEQSSVGPEETRQVGRRFDFSGLSILAPSRAPGAQSGRDRAIQRKCGCTGPRPCTTCSAPHAPHTGDVPEIAASSGTPLPASIRSDAESAFRADFSRVRVHTDGPATSAASRVQARAFTVDDHIYFGRGFYQPDTNEGRALVGHELTHVLQQRRGLSALDARGGDDPYEREADAMGRAFARGEGARIDTPAGGSRAMQRSKDPGAQAARVGTADSPYGLPFLGEANTPDELRALVAALAAELGVPTLAIVREDLAMGGAPAAEGVAGASAPAAGVAQASLRTRPIQTRPIQRSVVAGCNVPGVPPNVIGMAAHRQIEYACMAGASGCVGELVIPGDGRCDLMRQGPPPMIAEIGEIKPASWLGRGLEPLAAGQLAGYLVAYQAAFGAPAVPMWSYTFSGGPFLLNPSQVLTAWGPSGGLYFYRCSGGRRRRVREPVRVPRPAPVVSPAPAPAPESGVSGRDVARGAAAVGAGIGIGYLVYRGVRMIPSLFPPLWPTIPANLAVP